jgi:Synergist-CTERM protein sorting domain-containing protein
MRVRCSTFLFVLALVAILSPLAPAVAEESISAPINPAFLKYVEEAKAGRSAAIQGDHPTGYVPSPLDMSHLANQATTARNKGVLPTTYDLRTLGRVTSVKNQNPYGTCWAFATLGSVESFLMGDTVSGRSAENRDFSEMHLAWYAYTGADAFTTDTPAFGEDPILDQGGNLWKSTALLSRWTGPVNETDCIYSESERPVGNWSNYTNQKHLTDVHYLLWNASKTADTDIKNALMTYGGVAVAYYSSSTYYDPTNHTYYYNGANSSNHEVLVVGWDDNFDKTLFSPDAPANGAWIVKNSWGTTWGDNGYFYLSYSDASLADGAAFVVGPKTNYDNVYYYDPLGWIMARGYSNPTGWFANIFTAGNGSAGKSTTGTETLAAVSFYTASANSTYDIRVYTGVTAGDPDSGALALGPVSGTLVTPGYHVVALPSTVPLTTGQRFSIVVTLTTPGYNFPIPYECYRAGYSEKATANPGESFISSNGAVWTDLTTADATANVCLKAFTKTSTTTPTPTTTITPTVTHTPTVTGGGGGGGGCSAGMFAPFALLLFVPLFLTRK